MYPYYLAYTRLRFSIVRYTTPYIMVHYGRDSTLESTQSSMPGSSLREAIKKGRVGYCMKW